MADTGATVHANNGMRTRIKAAKLDHDLHVALLMKREGLSKPEALVMAYLDGLQGLNDRLNAREPKLV